MAGVVRERPAAVVRDDPAALRRCIRDLLALSALPGLWKSLDARQIAESVAEALISMLDAEFVHITLPLPDEPVLEVTRTRNPGVVDCSGRIRRALSERLPGQSLDDTAEIPNPVGEGTVRVASTPIGLGGNAVLVAGSGRPDFPTEAQHLILRVGANQTAIAVDRWRAEADQRRFVALVERSSEFIGFSSLDGARQYLNPAGRKLLGLDSMEEARATRILDYVVPEERARVREELWPTAIREGRWVGEINLRHFKTGAAIPFLVDWFRIDDPRTGQPMNIAAVNRDLTAQKEAEAELRHLNETLEHRVTERTAELAEANEWLLAERMERERTDARLHEVRLELFHAARLSAAGQMAAALAHELNQPLTAAANFINAARRGLADADRHGPDTVRDDMNEAAGQILRAGQIIRRLRDFAGGGETEKRIESVVTMVEEASALALVGSGALGVEARFRFDPNATWAFADRIQIQQVLINLMRNALEAMAGSGRRELTVSTALLDEETIEIAVADSGPGLVEDAVDHLFDPFVSTKAQGMGLGLSICRTIVESHGGRIRATENSGGGLALRFTLPAAPGDENDNVC
jgi:PAS domain S-box-containing protein